MVPHSAARQAVQEMISYSAHTACKSVKDDYAGLAVMQEADKPD